MAFRRLRMLLVLFAVAAGMIYPALPGATYDVTVYNNLMKSRDALIAQRGELQQAHDDVDKQVDLLQAKQNRLDSYLRQVNSALRDVDEALKGVR
jgi:hypothetical protein